MAQAQQCRGIAIRVRGQVQGVGFRPFIWQIAHELGHLGEVLNDSEGVLIKLADPDCGDAFIKLMHQRLPPLAHIDSVETASYSFELVPEDFVITASKGGHTNTRIAPDTATCDACIGDIKDPSNRRYHYPFTNCTHCGPRFSIIKDVPYDRPYTSMAAFPLCPSCQHEYDNPADRRFHAQPNACDDCGPQLQLVDAKGEPIHLGQDALVASVAALKQGKIVAIKGVGGYHLAVDATNADAVAKLRLRKHRPAKPFAMMARDIDVVKDYADVNVQEEQELINGAAPIVLLQRNTDSDLADNVAPAMATIGLMLPSNPLQHLLLGDFNAPLVMTSGNASGKPPCIDDEVALSELGSIADLILRHNRQIVNRVDDSIVRVDSGVTMLLRRARGYVPTPITLPPGFEKADNLLAYGADLKNTFCYLKQGQAIMSPHLGDLSDLHLRQAYQDNLALFSKLFSVKSAITATDPHPNYYSHAIATEQTTKHQPPFAVQHHHAHMAACMVDNAIPLDTEPMLGLILDGLGWGGEGTEHQLWGAELFYGNYHDVDRITGLTAQPLLGGDLAAQQPWRNLLVQLEHSVPDWQQFDANVVRRLEQKPLSILRKGLASGINSPKASSAGRLFDAVAALISDKFESISFEGEAAMVLESMAWRAFNKQAVEREIVATDHIEMTQLWRSLLTQVSNGVSPCEVALSFHQQFASQLLGLIATQQKTVSVSHVVLSGGVMQNQLLVYLLVFGIRQLGLIPLTHKQVPANDGGLSLGQAAIAWARHSQGGMA